MDDLYNNSLAETFDVIAITESNLCNDIQNSEVFDPRYVVFRQDRNFEQSELVSGGGVLCAVINNYSASQLFVNSSSPFNHDVLWIKIKFLPSVHIYFCIVYFRPGSAVEEYEFFIENFPSEILSNPAHIVILGDFNIHVDSEFNNFSCHNSNSKINVLSSLIHQYQLYQVNNVPNINHRFLDLVLTTIDPQKITLKHSTLPLIVEDRYHPALESIFVFPKRDSLDTSDVHRGNFKFNFKAANVDLIIAEMLSVNWNSVINMSNVNDSVREFYALIENVLKRSVPISYPPKKSGYPAWFSSNTRRILKDKKRALRNYRASLSVHAYNCFSELRRVARHCVRSDRLNNTARIENDIISDPSRISSYMKSDIRSAIPNVMCLENTSSDNPEIIVDLFASHFASVYNRTDTSNYSFDNLNIPQSSSVISISRITSSEIEHVIKDMSPTFTVGEDGIPAWLIKNCVDALLSPLCHIFQLSLNAGYFPDVWKKSKILPVFKKGNKHSVTNYRPIAILNVFSKIYEAVMYNRIFPQVKGFISNAQHGFFPGRSVSTNLLCLKNVITSVYNEGSQLDVVYIDFRSAFDSVSHNILMHKLELMGFDDSLRKWLLSFLSGRILRVHAIGAISSPFVPHSGLPQGSKFGNLLFILFINDLIQCLIYSSALIFADDTKFYRVIRHLLDCHLLQTDIINVLRWCEENKLFLNISKCNIMSFTTAKSIIHFNYVMGIQEISRPQVIRDLGICFDTKLNFDAHVNNIVAKAYSSLGFVMRKSRSFRRCEAIKLLYSTYVRTQLEFSAVVWMSDNAARNDYIERVQKRFLRFLFLKENGFYPFRIPTESLESSYAIDSLSKRRKISAILFYTKLVQGAIDCPTLLESINFHATPLRLRTRPLFVIPSARIRRASNFALLTFYSVMNNLSSCIDLFFHSVTTIRRICRFVL